MACYYTYCFYNYKLNKVKSLPYPQEDNAITFAHGLCALYGVVPLEILNLLGEKNACDMLTKFTGHSYQIVGSVSANMVNSKVLSLSRDENARLRRKLKAISEYTSKQKL